MSTEWVEGDEEGWEIAGERTVDKSRTEGLEEQQENKMKGRHPCNLNYFSLTWVGQKIAVGIMRAGKYASLLAPGKKPGSRD